MTIPDAVFREFPTKTIRKLTVSGRNILENARWINPVTGSVHRNTASMKSPEYHGAGRFRAGLFDMGRIKIK
jgi:hypothetical protein